MIIFVVVLSAVVKPQSVIFMSLITTLSTVI